MAGSTAHYAVTSCLAEDRRLSLPGHTLRRQLAYGCLTHTPLGYESGSLDYCTQRRLLIDTLVLWRYRVAAKPVNIYLYSP